MIYVATLSKRIWITANLAGKEEVKWMKCRISLKAYVSTESMYGSDFPIPLERKPGSSLFTACCMLVKDPIAITNIHQSVKFTCHDQAHPLAERKLSNFGPCSTGFNRTKVSKCHVIYVFPTSSWKITLATLAWILVQWKTIYPMTELLEEYTYNWNSIGSLSSTWSKNLKHMLHMPIGSQGFVETTSPVNGLSSFRWGPTGVKLDLVGFASVHTTSVARIPSDWSASDLSAWGHWMLHLMKYLLFGSRKGNCHRFLTTQITSLEVVAIFFVFGVSYKWEPKDTKSTLPVYNLQSAGGALTHFWHRKWWNLLHKTS